MTELIKVSDRLPNKNEHVLLTWDGKYFSKQTFYNHEEKKWQREVNSNCVDCHRDIISWVPWPEAPND